MTGRSHATAALSAALLVIGCAAPNEHAVDTGRGAPADVSLTLEPYFRELKLVRVSAGADTLSLLLDTGGGATLVTPADARRMGCQPHGADVGHRMTGEAVAFQRCDSLRISVGVWTAALMPVGVFDVNALLPPELPRLDGVLALDAFQGSAVTLDWSRGTLTVHAPATADGAMAQTGVHVRVASGESGRFLSVLARVEGRREPLWFLLDSGNLRGTLVARSVLRASLLALASADSVQLRLGGRAPVTLPFAAADLVLDGALGVDFLMRGPVTIDLRGAGPGPR
jgi:hypothetical protein